MSERAAGQVFRIPIALRWSDLDAFNHVNNSRYLTFLEQARIEWFETLDAPWMTDEVAPGDQVVILHRGRVLFAGLAAQAAADGDLTRAFLELTGVPA